MAVFTYVADFGATKQKAPKVTNISFGDGYKQRASFGVNTNPDTWALQFANRSESDATAIDDFLTARAGVESFDWTPPGSATARKFICQKWTKTTVKANLFSIDAEFEEVFE